MRKFSLILSFAIIAIGFGVSLHRSLTGNGLLDENLDSHILAQLDGSSDDTGGDNTGGDKTGGDDTGGGINGPDSIYYLRDQILNEKKSYVKMTSSTIGEIYIMGLKFYNLLPNTTYYFKVVDTSCIKESSTNCDRREQRVTLFPPTDTPDPTIPIQ